MREGTLVFLDSLGLVVVLLEKVDTRVLVDFLGILGLAGVAIRGTPDIQGF